MHISDSLKTKRPSVISDFSPNIQREFAVLMDQFQSLEVIPSIDLDPPAEYLNLFAFIEKEKVLGWLDGGKPGCVADVFITEVANFNDSSVGSHLGLHYQLTNAVEELLSTRQ